MRRLGSWRKRAAAHLRASLRDQRGYTLVELVTLTGIVSLLAGLVIASTSVGNQRQLARDAAFGYVNAARQAESLAASARAVPDANGNNVSRKAYGVCVTSTAIANSRCAPISNPATQRADMYQIYARAVNDTSYTSPPTNPDIISSHYADPSVPGSGRPSQVTLSNPTIYLDYLPPGPSLRVNGLPSAANPACPSTAQLRFVTGGYGRNVGIRACAGAVYVE